jgi:serine phosphatase RsbU (regulator of sigma subunit)
MELLTQTKSSISFTVNQSLNIEKRLAFLEEQAQTLQESMRYAGSLQRSILPNERIFQNTFTDAFVIFQPKDIVSGDFYWIYQHHDDVYFAVGDCTGHGVPGAMVNIAGNALLRQIIRLEGLSDPGKIMYLLDQELTSLFNENLTVGTTRDGMDIVFCKFNLTSLKGSFCGAGRPLILIRDGQLVEFKKGPDAIGHNSKDEKVFETIHFGLEKGDQFYLFSDGYTDQFGGENVKKFNRGRFRNMLLSIQEYSSIKQKEELLFTYNNWKGKQDQVDDICVVGIKI